MGAIMGLANRPRLAQCENLLPHERWQSRLVGVVGLALAAGALPATAFGQVPNGGRPAIGTTQLLHPVIQPSAAQAQIHAIQPVPGQIPQATANVSGQIAHLPGTFYQPQATANVSVQAAHLPGTFYQSTGQSTGAAGISTNARNMSTVTSAAPDKS